VKSMFSLSAMVTRSSHFFKGPGSLVRKPEVCAPAEISFEEEPAHWSSSAREQAGAPVDEARGLRLDFSQLLRLRSFGILLAITGIGLFQVNNILAIKNLSARNDRLRSTIRLTRSVLASQELKVRELQSIHSLTEVAGALGLASSSEPPVLLEP